MNRPFFGTLLLVKIMLLALSLTPVSAQVKRIELDIAGYL